MGSGYLFGSGLKGSKVFYVGKSTHVFEYQSPADCISKMEAGDVMMVYPGTYELAATLSIVKPIHIIGIGDVTINGGTAGIADRLISVGIPAAGTLDQKFTFENIKFANAYAAADVFEIDNDGGALADMYVYFKNCSIDCEATGLAIDFDQNEATKNIFLFISGGKEDVVDACNVENKKAGNIIDVFGLEMAGVITASADDFASSINLQHCTVAHAAGVAGGHASQLLCSNAVISKTGTTLAAADTNEFTGSQTENIIAYD